MSESISEAGTTHPNKNFYSLDFNNKNVIIYNMKGNKPMLNIARIAKECGVSAMTVSRALRKDLSVSDSTRKQILAVAEKMDYHSKGKMGRPRRLKKTMRPLVDVIIGTSTRQQALFYSAVLVTIEQELAKHSHDCVIRTCNAKYAQFLSLCETLRNSSAIGTIILGYLPVKQLRTILDLLPNSILVDHTGDPRLECPYESVGFDNVEAARLAVRHLVNIGQRQILLLKGFFEHYFSREIEQGYIEVLRESNIPIDEKRILECDFTADGAYKVISSALDSGLKFDGIFTNDEMACGVFRALHERRLNIPKDVSIVGCDGLPVGLHLIPRLTTVILDYEKLGQMAVERLFTSREKLSSPCRIRLVPVLEIRESTVKNNRRRRNGVS